jgi:hypothetical protein
MITIEVLRDIGFFEKVPALQKLCLSYEMEDIYLSPSIRLENDPRCLYLAVKSNEDDGNSFSNFINFSNAVHLLIEPILHTNNLTLNLFSTDALELVEDDSDYYTIYKRAESDAIPIENLNQNLSLEAQWAIQGLSQKFIEFGQKKAPLKPEAVSLSVLHRRDGQQANRHPPRDDDQEQNKKRHKTK